MSPMNFGLMEIIISCFAGLTGLGLPVAILVFLILIYTKLKNIEETLKKE